jgi:nicotinamidase-related amidase
LEKILNDKESRRSWVVGTAAQAAVLNTASQAAFLGLRVIVPLDGMSAENTITSSTPPPIYQPLLASANR